MDLENFETQIKHIFPIGTIIQNPGRGTTLIKSYSKGKIYYQRGKSTMSVKFSDLHAAYFHFVGRRMATTDLRQFKPFVFDSSARPAGHSCNCTLLFLLLFGMRLCGDVEGAGRIGNPFYVKVLMTT